MRIGLVSTVASPVGRNGSASVEGLVWTLSHELVALGHDVTVFATGDSQVCGKLVAALPGPYGKKGSPDNWLTCELINLSEAAKHSSRFDVLHSHCYLYGLAVQGLVRTTMANTTHIAGDQENASLWRRCNNGCVTAISHYQWSAFPDLKPAVVIYHGIDQSQFTFQPKPEDYVCYLGRFSEGKGPLLAIQTARSLGLRLVLAGPLNGYYTKRIAPLVDGHSVEYVGPVSGVERDQLLGGARALLHPIQKPEPFGMVLVEAMMCGTPVATIGLGAVPEVVDYGISGCYSEPGGDFSQAVLEALTLDRQGVRDRAVTRFSARRMASEYVQLYQGLIENSKL